MCPGSGLSVCVSVRMGDSGVVVVMVSGPVAAECGCWLPRDSARCAV